MIPWVRIAVAIACLASGSAGQVSASVFKAEVRPFMDRWCIKCHGGRKQKAGLNLELLQPKHTSNGDVALVLKIRNHLRDGTMPPSKRRRPNAADVSAVVGWANGFLGRAINATVAGPGRVTVRRLSRQEYDNTTRSLLGVVSGVSATFPRDDLGYGFDNIGDAVTTSQIHVERYMAAAEDIALQAISTEDTDNPPSIRRQAEEMRVSRKKSTNRGGDFVTLFTNGSLLENFELPRDGLYRVRARVFATQSGNELARMELRVDGDRRESVDVDATRRHPETHEEVFLLKGGIRTIEIAFVNDHYAPESADRKKRDRNLYLDWVEVVGPIDSRPLPEAHVWIFKNDVGKGAAKKRAQKLIKRLLTKLWRRPARPSEIRRLCTLVEMVVDEGEPFERGMQVALQAALVSPNFLFRLEPGGKGSSGQVHELNPWALASRLSYFLWSGPPDSRLFDLARTGKLSQPSVLEDEARRMLEDPRGAALSVNFLPQWLELRNLTDIHPDPERFPAFDESLRRAMLTETTLLFQHVLRDKLPVSTLLNAPFTYLNARLARHYGIEGVRGDEFRQVVLDDRKRGGLLGHASVHTVTSNPTRTSPVKRGKWILTNILDAPPPPPPPGEDSFDEDVVKHAATLREQMEMHRREPRCAACHERMDTLGLALENYNAIGRWRDVDGKTLIDASGVLPDGSEIDGPLDLQRVLMADRSFARCLLRKLFVYGVGRDTTPADVLVLDGMLDQIGADPSVVEMVIALVKMDAFRKRVVTR